MARPRTVVKNELSIAIVELRRALGHSQQSFAQFLGMSIGAVARWELNSRPHRTVLKRLIDLAPQDREDLREIFYSAYRREFGLAYDREAATKVGTHLLVAIRCVESLPITKTQRREVTGGKREAAFTEQFDKELERTREFILQQLRAAFEQVSKFPTDPEEFKTDKDKQP